MTCGFHDDPDDIVAVVGELLLADAVDLEQLPGGGRGLFGDRGEREIDFVTYRKRLAEGARFDAALVKEILPPSARKKLES